MHVRHPASAVLWGLTALVPAAASQLSDLQPGRNYPTALTAFGAGRSENIDLGDVDHDGDYDVVVGNGGDGQAQSNYLYLNNGNLQGGTEGTFTDATAARFLGVPNDTSRDIELADVDGDTDLDVFISNRGTTVNGGEVSRAYRNQGGLQQGTVGFFLESTNEFWGTLVGVPLSSEAGVQDGQGPWRDFSCDCDFADFDADGDLDLFHTSYGPNINGTYDTRLFLNDGSGRFDELWPWADPAADVKLHTFDADVADFDGDWDLDIVASSRDSQARVYRNNLSENGWATDPFTDVTQTSFLDNGVIMNGGVNYEVEFGDLDADGDFDLWLVDFNSFASVTARNAGGLDFFVAPWLRGEANVDTNEVDFLDFDGDGDLDVFAATFSGTNYLWQSGRFDGLNQGQGMLHRTGTSAGGSLATWPETPTSSNGGTTLDAEVGDMDGDGDPDLLLANDANQQNRYWENELGVPDTHAPTFFQVTDQADKSDGSDTVIQAQVRDNTSHYLVAYWDTDLIYSVDGGPETCVTMTPMGGMQFRGVIPGGIDGAITYRVECTDDAGNTGVSATFDYVQTSSGAPLWQNLGCGTVGSRGVPKLSLDGSQVAGEPVDFALVDAHPSAFFLLWIAFTPVPAPAVGGTVYAFPFDSQVLATTDAGGMRFVSTAWPPGVPTGTEATWQCVVADPTSIHGLTLSNAVRSIAP